MPSKKKSTDFDKISNNSQVGGIETSLLDNGPARGTRIAWINTGTGLRYKVVLDRAMDIADAFYNQHSIAWIGRTGITSPQMMSNKGIDWLQTFGGGLLTTCGLSHIGGPEKDEYGERGLHGEISNIPAIIESIIQPDPANNKLDMSITGTMRQNQLFGPALELRRTIAGKIGDARISIHDEIINVGNTSEPHMLMYHFNFGWPIADEGTQILWEGSWKPRNENLPNRIFNETHDFHTCPGIMDEHLGTGEDVGIIDIEEDEQGKCYTGLFNPKLDLAVSLTFNKKELPWLTNWQHWGKGEYVTGLEPCTHPPHGQAWARKNKSLLHIEPGEKTNYNIELEVLFEEEKINSFLEKFKSEK